jgi:hypothetical protein
MLVSFALAGMTFISAMKRHCWAMLLTHFVVLLYWLVSSFLMATGVKDWG